MSRLFEPHEINDSHQAACPGCVAKMIELEVTRQVNAMLEQVIEISRQIATEQERKDTKNG